MAIEISSLIFTHMPKTGGSYVTNILQQQCGGKRIAGFNNHDPAFLIKERIHTDKKFFTFIRHPLSLVCSAWGHWSSVNCRKNHERIEKSGKSPWSYAMFSEFWQKNIVEKDLEKTVENINTDSGMTLNSFYELYTKEVDIIGKQEQLNQDLRIILENSGHKITQQKKINAYSHKVKLKISHYNVQKFFEKYYEIIDKHEYNYTPNNIEII